MQAKDSPGESSRWFEPHEGMWLFLLQIAVEVRFYIDTGKSGKVNEREKYWE